METFLVIQSMYLAHSLAPSREGESAREKRRIKPGQINVALGPVSVPVPTQGCRTELLRSVMQLRKEKC